MQCPDCTFNAKSRAGLETHKRRSHLAERPAATASSNAAAIEVTLAELKRMGRLERVDAAKVQALRSMAGALDVNPFNSQMWREYREAIEVLATDDSNDGSVDRLIDELSTTPRDET